MSSGRHRKSIPSPFTNYSESFSRKVWSATIYTSILKHFENRKQIPTELQSYAQLECDGVDEYGVTVLGLVLSKNFQKTYYLEELHRSLHTNAGAGSTDIFLAQ